MVETKSRCAARDTEQWRETARKQDPRPRLPHVPHFPPFFIFLFLPIMLPTRCPSVFSASGTAAAFVRFLFGDAASSSSFRRFLPATAGPPRRSRFGPPFLSLRPF